MFCFFQFFLQDCGRIIFPYTKRDTNWIRSTHKAIFIQYSLFSSCIATIYALFFGGIFYIEKKRVETRHEHSNTADVLFMLEKIFNSRIYRWKMPTISENGKHTSDCRQTAPFSKHCNTMILWHFWAIFFYCRSENLYQYKITIK